MYMKKILFLLSLLLIPTTFANYFSDVSNTYPYLEAINYSKENNIVSWYKDWTFQPENEITREEFTKIIIKSNFSDLEIYWEDCFPDVDWWDFEKYICTAKRNGIIWWYKDWSFRPKDNISFLEAAKIIILGLWKRDEVTEANGLLKYWRHLSNRMAIPVSIDYMDSKISRWEMVEIIWRLKEKVTWKESRYIGSREIKAREEFWFWYNIINGELNFEWRLSLPDVDVSTIKLLGWWYYVSDNKVYYESHELEGVEIENFKVLGESYWQYLDKIYFWPRKITYPEIDLNKFEVLEKWYAKDEYYIYHDDLGFEIDILDWADVDSFQVLKYGYSMDKNNMYISDLYSNVIKIEGVDLETFEILEENFLRDKNSVYYWENKVDDVDSETFEVLSYNYSRDKNYVYTIYWGFFKKVENANPETFKALNENYWKDSKNVYRHDVVVDWVDVETFEILDYYYAKDKNNVYYYDWDISNHSTNIVDGADVLTFVAFYYRKGKDKDYIYFEWKRID